MGRLSYVMEWAAYASIVWGMYLAWEPLGWIAGGLLILQAILRPTLTRPQTGSEYEQ